MVSKIPSDSERHTGQRKEVEEIMADGKERTLQQISDVIHAPTQSVGARLRELRKPKYGSYQLISRRTGDPRYPIYVYRLVAARES